MFRVGDVEEINEAGSGWGYRNRLIKARSNKFFMWRHFYGNQNYCTNGVVSDVYRRVWYTSFAGE